MKTLAVVKDLDVAEDGGPKLDARAPRVCVNQLCFERSEEAFGDGVVPALAVHADLDAERVERRSVVLTGVLAAAVRVVLQARRWCSATNGLVERTQGQARRERCIKSPSDNASGEEVCQVAPAFVGPDVGWAGLALVVVRKRRRGRACRLNARIVLSTRLLLAGKPEARSTASTRGL